MLARLGPSSWGVDHLPRRQAALAGRGRRRARHQARSRPLLTRRRAAWLIRTSEAGPAQMIRMPDGIDGDPRTSSSAMAARASRADPDHRGDGRRRTPALRAVRPRRGADRDRPGGRARAASLELRADPIPSSRAVWCSTSTPAPDVDFADVITAAKEVRRSPGGAGARQLLQDHGRQGPARGHADLNGQGRRLAGRPRPSPATSARMMAADAPKPLPDQHGQEGPDRPDLPRLSPQRPHGHRRGAAVAAWHDLARRSPCRSPGAR